MLSNLNEEYKNKLKTIKNHFGEINQKAKLLEELEEFERAIREFYLCNKNTIKALWSKKTDISKILEELTDCYVVAEQINKIDFLEFVLIPMLEFYILDVNLLERFFKHGKRGEIIEIARQKIDRTLERIKTGYYEPDICPNCGGDGFHTDEGENFIDCELCNGTGKVERKEK
ncbi:hypothetical protein [Sebaldella sp. S0638]|uniref:hypothetical protein n=1 Tax=Sebaldella sp. S0638 TaxID=2957809 RepID=UPI0020A0B783|nr:hypothetical protein [Sebaldella sp. S0638]MCP1225697.1 hypothetical protein [Sebaldella sp. S0638]